MTRGLGMKFVLMVSVAATALALVSCGKKGDDAEAPASKAPPATKASSAPTAAAVDLFNGKDFSGWKLVTKNGSDPTKVWRVETRMCVATHSHGDKPLWTAKWLPKSPTKSEMFALGGGNNSISFYREAAG